MALRSRQRFWGNPKDAAPPDFESGWQLWTLVISVKVTGERASYLILLVGFNPKLVKLGDDPYREELT